MQDRTYIAIDLKSFYASVECMARGLDPLDTNLVVADAGKTEKTICLAVTPSLKAWGIPGRARLFEVVQKVNQANALRRSHAPGGSFTGKSCFGSELTANPALELDYIVAPPRMAHYMEVSTQIFNIYSSFVSPEDMHVYSIDEVFIDATPYLGVYGLSARDFAMKLIREVLSRTGITATAGIGPNMYLCKIAMDVEAKHIPADSDGVRICELDEMSYREKLWDHRPLTDFWRVGKGISNRLERMGIHTMGDIAEVSLRNEDLLYKEFGVNAELLIDHAWGWEPCRISDIKSYVPENSSLSSGQVLSCPYSFEKGRLIAREMTDLLVLDLVEKKLVTDRMELTVVYDVENLTDPELRKAYSGPIVTDIYGREMPKQAHGGISLASPTSSTRLIIDAVTELYERIVDPKLLVRRLYVVADHVIREDSVPPKEEVIQLDLFTDLEAEEEKRKAEEKELERERRRQEAILDIKRKYGKNAVLKGMNFEEGATTIERNRQVGGHKA